MAIQVGDKVPSATLKYLSPEGPKEITTDELFRGKKVALFAVPGAFTPTCSQRHLPGYVDKASRPQGQGHRHDRLRRGQRRVRDGRLGQGPELRRQDHDAGRRQRRVHARGRARAGRAQEPGLGVRSQRYSMLVEDGVVKKLNVEAPGKFEVSDADAMLKAL